MITEHEKQVRKNLVEKAKFDLERLSQMPGQIEKIKKMIKDSGIMKLFDEFIQGTITQTAFAKNLQDTANCMLENLQELEESNSGNLVIEDSTTTPTEGKKKRKQKRR